MEASANLVNKAVLYEVRTEFSSIVIQQCLT